MPVAVSEALKYCADEDAVNPRIIKVYEKKYD